MKFTAGPARDQRDVVEVRYDCACGCKPRASYRRATQEAGHEHCCCGIVHFVGAQAPQRLESYLAERRARGEDTDMRYTLYTQEVRAPWGEPVPVAYALPDQPKPH